MPKMPSPATEIRTLKRELKVARQDLRNAKDRAHHDQFHLKLEVKELTAERDALKKDNERLEEIAGLLRQQLATERQIA